MYKSCSKCMGYRETRWYGGSLRILQTETEGGNKWNSVRLDSCNVGKARVRAPFTFAARSLVTALSSCVIWTNCLMFCDDVKKQQQSLGLQKMSTHFKTILMLLRAGLLTVILKFSASKCKAFNITFERNFTDSFCIINDTVLEHGNIYYQIWVSFPTKCWQMAHINVTAV